MTEGGRQDPVLEPETTPDEDIIEPLTIPTADGVIKVDSPTEDKASNPLAGVGPRGVSGALAVVAAVVLEEMFPKAQLGETITSLVG